MKGFIVGFVVVATLIFGFGWIVASVQNSYQEDCRAAGGTVSVKTSSTGRVCINAPIVDVP